MAREELTHSATPRPSRWLVTRRALHLIVLSSLAVAAPLFLVTDAQFYIGRDVAGGDVVLIALIVLLVPPAFAFAVELAALALGPRSALAAHLAFVGVFAALIASPLLLLADLPLVPHLVLALAVGGAGAYGYARSPGARAFLSALAPAPLLLAAFFLLISPTAQLVFADEDEVELADARAAAPVVLVVLDEFPGYALMDRRGRIDERRYPSFARLARDATWFPNATTSRSDTELAVPSVVTGEKVALDSLPTASEHPESIFTLLGQSHRIHASEPWTDLCPERLCPDTTRRSAGERIEPVLTTVPLILAHTWLRDPEGLGVDRPLESGAPDRNVQVGEWIAGIRDGSRPALDYLHVLFPHKPWRYLPSGAGYPDSVGRDNWLGGFERMDPDPWVARQYQQRFLLQLGHVDRLLGRLLDRLRRQRLYRESMVVVVADHGASFLPGEARRDATEATAADILSVPLFVKAPGQRRGSVDERPALTVDVLPTIADGIGAELPWEVDGDSLLSGDLPARSLQIENIDADPIALDLAEFESKRDSALRRQLRIFGSGDPNRIYGIGPHSGLVGRRVAALPAVERPEGEVTLGDGLDALSYDPGAATVPARIAGTVTDVGAGKPLAVALNGRVVATTFSYDGESGVEFSAIYPPRLLDPGRNAIAVLAIEEDAGRPALGRLELAG